MRPLWSPRNASNAGISRVLTERFCAASENFSQRLADSHNLSQIGPLRNRQRMDLPARISTLQRTDRWFGAPLCAILTLFRRIFESGGPSGPRQVQRILFVKFAEQGSTVLAYPAIRRAIEMVGRENVYFVVFEDNRFILDAMEIIPDGNVITIATKSLFVLATGALLQRENPRIGSAPLILLNPNASDLLPLRRWPPLRYVELARRLLERYPEPFIGLTGAPAEAASNNQLADEVGSDRVIRLAGKTTLRQLLALYARSEILVTNDSGPAHFASLTPIRVVTLFGPETPALFAVRSPNATALWAGIACSPCVNAYNNRQSVCRNNLCMQAITVDDVFEEVTRIYDSLKRSTSGN